MSCGGICVIVGKQGGLGGVGWGGGGGAACVFGIG